MYPHVVTVIHKTSTLDEDTYQLYVLNGVYLQASRGIIMNGLSFTLDSATLISTNVALARSYGTSWQCEEGDRILTGEYTDDIMSRFENWEDLDDLSWEDLGNMTWNDLVTAYADFEDAMVVKKIEKNIANTDLDSIVIHAE